MDNGQANGPETLESLAGFLEDNPDADASGPPRTEKQPPSDEPDEDNSDETTEDPAQEDGEKPESDEAEEQPSLTFKVTVKGEDGADTTVEVDQKELVAGYQRHSDYTRKTQELATKEREVTQVVATRLQEGQNYYLQQAQIAQAAVRQLAGLRSPEEMAVLAQNDPAQWVQENQRAMAINGVMSQLQEGIQKEQAQRQQAEQQNLQKAFSTAWEVLGKEGIDKPALQKIYATATERYGIPKEALANLYDPKQVLILRDAIAYQELKQQKATVVKKVADAPRLPTQKQSVPRDEVRSKALNKRFENGKAKLDDLAAYLSANNL